MDWDVNGLNEHELRTQACQCNLLWSPDFTKYIHSFITLFQCNIQYKIIYCDWLHTFVVLASLLVLSQGGESSCNV